MKKMLFSSLLILIMIVSKAQNCDDYSFSASLESYEAINGTFITVSAPTEGGANVGLPFTFTFAGTNYTSIYVSANGWLSFTNTYNSGSVSYNNTNFNSGSYSTVIAPYWDDLTLLNAANSISHSTEGVAPNRIFTIQYADVIRFQQNEAPFNMQVKFYEGSNHIAFVYGSGFTAFNYGNITATIGINNGSTHFISVTPTGQGTATYSTTVANNSINASVSTLLVSGTTYLFSYPSIECTQPTSLTANSITTNSANLVWTAGSTGSQWLLSYKSEAQNSWSEEVLTTTTNMPLTNLSPSTYYNVRIRTLCGIGDTSLFRTTQFNTLCGSITTVPYLENFDHVAVNLFPICWTKVTAYNSDPSTYSLYSSSAPNSLRFDGRNNECIASPAFEAEVNTLRVAFKLRLIAQSNVGTFSVGAMSDPADISTFIQSVEITPSDVAAWTTYDNIYFNDIPDGYHYIAFRHNCNVANAIAIDDIVVSYAPTCQGVHDLIVTDILENQASVSWSSYGTPISWLVSYKIQNASVWSDEVAVYTPSYLLTALALQTYYDVRVRAVCTIGDTSAYLTATFRTTQALATIPYSDNFENNPDWEIYNGSFTNHWVIGNSTTANDNGGTACLYIANDSMTPPTYAYTTTSITSVYAIKALYFTQAGEHIINYDWKAFGEFVGNYARDYMSLWLAPSSYTFSPDVVFDTTGLINLFGSDYLYLHANWSHKNISFDIPSVGVYQLIVNWRNDYSGGTQPPGAIDNIVINRADCPRVSNLQVTNISTNSATVSWTTGDTETEWRVSYKAQSASVWSNEITANSNSLPINGLNPQTIYDVRVRAVCGLSTFSEYRYTSFTTACNDITILPYFENFDSYNMYDFPMCWTRAAATTVNTHVVPYTTYDFNYSDPYSLYFVGNSVSCAASPRFVAEVNTLQLSFRIKRSSIYSGTFSVGVMSDPNDMSTYIEIQTCTSPIGSSWGYYEDISFTNVPNGYHYIAFKKYDDGADYYCIDDIEVMHHTNCSRVSNITATNVFQNQATITWSSGSTATLWLFSYKTQLATIWSQDYLVSNTPSYTILGLTPLTSYDVRIRPLCTALDTGYYRMGSFSTVCDFVNANYYTENFDTYGDLEFPPCWTKSSSYGGGLTTYPYVSSAESATQPYSLVFSGHNNQCATTPGFILDVNNYKVAFMVRRQNTNGGTLSLGALSNPYDMSTFVEVATITSPVMVWDTVLYIDMSIVPAGYHYIAFRQNSNDGGYLWLDDVQILKINNCQPPQNIDTIATTSSSIQLKWSSTESSLYYIAQPKLASSANWYAETSPIYDTTYQFTGFTINTDYIIRIKSYCTGNDFSEWDTVYFSTRDKEDLIISVEPNPKTVLYPNPTCQSITVEYHADYTHIDIFNLLGEKMLSTIHLPSYVNGLNQITIEVSALPNGIYFARLKGREHSVMLKFVKIQQQ